MAQVFRDLSDNLKVKGFDAIQDSFLSETKALRRELLGTLAKAMGPAIDAIDITSDLLDEDYYGAAGTFVGAVAGAALGVALIAFTGWISIPAVLIFSSLTSSSFEDLFNYFDPLGINDKTNKNYTDAKKFTPRRDPLTLDLNNNGIETLDLDKGVVFDFNGDGTKTGTGWIAPSDGFLVLDKDGNGTIDNGNELFGVDTIKSDGTKAVDGFDALRDLDSNGDGIFDRNDEMFSKVKVWQDLNGDGVSQANELKKLDELGIVSINLDATKANIDSNGNIISAIGTFIREDGSTGEANANQSVVANLDLTDNPFYREFTDKIALDEHSKSLPDLKGSGAVRDLREATMLNQNLKQILTEYAAANTRGQQLSLLDTMVSEWSASAKFETFDKKISKLTIDGKPLEFKFSWEVNGTQPTESDLKTKQFFEQLSALETFNAKGFIEYTWVTDKDGKPLLSIKVGAIETFFKVDKFTTILTEKDIAFDFGQKDFLGKAYAALETSIYDGLLLKTRLNNYVSAIEFSIDGNTKKLLASFDQFSSLFNSRFVTEPVEAFNDLLDLNRVFGEQLNTLGSQHLTILQTWLTSSAGTPIYDQLVKAAKDFNYDLSTSGTGSSGNDLLVSTKEGDILSGGAGNDLILGGDGDDFIRGGAGNDTLYGGKGNDTYFFEIGGGNDTIIETNGDTDTLLFGEGISIGDITIAKEGNNLILSLSNGRDSVTI